MVLARIQAELAAIYGTPIHHPVADFLITDASLARALTPPEASVRNQERLLLREADGELDVSLYVDAAVVQQLEVDDPLAGLHEGNFAAFLVALEGVSHFHYVISHCLQADAVTPLELELQAEVDKYVTCVRLFTRQLAGRVPPALHAVLFEGIRFDEGLDHEARMRYEEANFFAAMYCARLQRRYPGAYAQPGFLHELRTFYRASRNDKIRRTRMTH